MIKFTDFIKPPNPNRTKVKFNMNASDTSKLAWDYLLDDDNEWLLMNKWKTKHPSNNLNHADYLIAMAQYYPYGAQYYIFGGIFEVKKISPEVFNDFGYELTPITEYEKYTKRLIIKLKKPIGWDIYCRQFNRLDGTLMPEVYELAPSTKLGHFPGYQNVSLRHNDLRRIISSSEPSWKQALSYVKGVYVITDTKTGKIYIGSASGNNEGIWQRWAAYADEKNMTGGNVEFVDLLRINGHEYLEDNFKYSILEIFDTKTKSEIIIARENYWKNVFLTRQFGMNQN
jgi:hypothetical protein